MGTDGGGCREMDLISVIVPVYNVGEYLCECIDSILSQTYQNLEIILVDDGSMDDCPELCDSYASKDSRVKVIHQENRGLSAARNKGYEASSGRYIAFVDADDMIFSTYIEMLYSLIVKNNAQIAICSYTRAQNGQDEKTVTQEYVLPSEKMLKEWHGKRKSIETVVWNKLYSREIFEKFEHSKIFPEGKTHEDIYTSHLFVSLAKTIAITNKILYFYRKREKSISRTYTKEAAKADLDAQKARMRFFKERRLYGAYMRLLRGHWMHRGMYVTVRREE